MVSTNRKKALNNQEYVFFWTEKCVSINLDEGFLEKYLWQGHKMVSASHKISFHLEE